MKRIILCLFGLTFFALSAKSQAYLGTLYYTVGHGDGSSMANDQPTVYLDGEYLRFSFTVHVPNYDFNLTPDSQIGFGLNGGDMMQTLYALDFSYGTHIPYSEIITYSGSYYVGNLPETYFDLRFNADFPTYDNTIIGNGGVIGFTYYPN